VAFFSTMAAGLITGQSMAFVARDGLHGALATIAAAFLVEGLLPSIERLFNFSTSMTLLEWCDANRPLLRLLAAEAPGTYNHSLLVGALAEKACEAIGANGLLARAGAYYHDVGKTNKPEYFVENQGPQFSRHERLSPAMSLLIIINHVKDGIEMAKEYRLPVNLRPFIAEHHGTTVVEYFYAAANNARKAGEPPIPDMQFRYPGPKPQTRESAVVMLADGVEGAVRAMPEPTPARIEDTVQRIVRKRLLDGQLDECDLNFRELADVEKSLIKTLNGIYHGRIAYPVQPAASELESTVLLGPRAVAERQPAIPPASGAPLDVGT
jgi:putative nucleotidyltransferase with HDIG domain